MKKRPRIVSKIYIKNMTENLAQSKHLLGLSYSNNCRTDYQSKKLEENKLLFYFQAARAYSQSLTSGNTSQICIFWTVLSCCVTGKLAALECFISAFTFSEGTVYNNLRTFLMIADPYSI